MAFRGKCTVLVYTRQPSRAGGYGWSELLAVNGVTTAHLLRIARDVCGSARMPETLALRVQTLLGLANSSAHANHSVAVLTDGGSATLEASAANLAAATRAWGANGRAREASSAGFGKCPLQASGTPVGSVTVSGGVTLVGATKQDDFLAAVASRSGVSARDVTITSYEQTVQGGLLLPIAASSMASAAARTQLASGIATVLTTGGVSPLVTLLSGWRRQLGASDAGAPAPARRRRRLASVDIKYSVVAKADVSSAMLSSSFSANLARASGSANGPLPAFKAADLKPSTPTFKTKIGYSVALNRSAAKHAAATELALKDSSALVKAVRKQANCGAASDAQAKPVPGCPLSAKQVRAPPARALALPPPSPRAHRRVLSCGGADASFGRPRTRRRRTAGCWCATGRTRAARVTSTTWPRSTARAAPGCHRVCAA